jgi:hypothetical protein
MANQMDQDVEDLRLNGDQLTAAPQFAPVAIDRAAAKREPHRLFQDGGV